MSRRASVLVTANFQHNLDNIRLFLEEREAPQAFEDLVIPNLQTFPQIGFDLLSRAPESTQGLSRVRALQRRLGSDTSLREYVAGDYLVLYALHGDRIHLLSIKHHRQLSFDLRALWRR